MTEKHRKDDKRKDPGAGFRSFRRVLIGLAAALTASLPVGAVAIPGGWTDVDEHGTSIRPIVFPVVPGDGDMWYSDTWLAPRGGGSRRHLGTDVMGEKLMPLLAARAGCVTWISDGGGNALSIEDAEGWQYRYIHINNDSPGTDDGANPREWAFVDGLDRGDCVEAGQHIAYLGDSGNAENCCPHLHFEIIRPDGIWINPYFSVKAAEEAEAAGGSMLDGVVPPPDAPAPVGGGDVHPLTRPVDPDDQCRPRQAPTTRPNHAVGPGYWLLDGDGTVHAFGDAEHLGDLGDVDGPEAVSMQATASGGGYWIVDADGVVHAFGDAEAHGDMSGTELNGPVRRLEGHPHDGGYWLVADDGGVFTFGSAGFHGSMGATKLDAPVISMTATADGRGYWLVGGDGGVFSFGNASFHGSTGGMTLDAPVIDMAVHPDGDGYWLYARDGGVFAFGDVGFHGSLPGLGLCDPDRSVALRPTVDGGGYWIATAHGEVHAFGNAPWYGDGPSHTGSGHTHVVDFEVAPVHSH